MSLRIPLTPDQTLQVEFHEIERRLRRLEKAGKSDTTTVRVIGGGGTGSADLTSIYNRLAALEAAAGDALEVDDIPNLVGVGSGAQKGLAPSPGLAEPPTGVAQHLLTEDATWGFPLRGLISVATSGEQTDPPYDVVTLEAGVHAQNTQVADLACHDLHIAGEVEYQHTLWKDLRFPAQGINPAGTASPPGIDTADPYAGTFLFDAASTEVIAGIAQLPHEWKTETAIYPHIHWVPTDAGAGNVGWRFSYQIADIDGNFPGSLTTAGIEVDAADGSATKHQDHRFSAITMTGYAASCVIIWKVERVGGDASDTYGADARLLEFDIHYETDKPGDPDPP